MKKQIILFILIALTALNSTAQSGKNLRIGYIDMEYILENVPEYNEANIQLEQKAQKWKQEMEAKKNDITKLKESLKTEQVLLTKELIQERQDEITFLENELMEYQQKRFGPSGELVVQKAVLVKPIQDQIFTAVQDLAEARKYDFIFDKSSDMTMLFAAKRYDISDYVVRTLARASKRNQMSKKQIKEEEAKEYKENLEDVNPDFAARQKALEDRKAAREKLIEDRKAAFEAKRQEALAKKQQAQDARNNKQTDSVKSTPVNPTTDTDKKGPKANETPQTSVQPTSSNTVNDIKASSVTETQKSSTAAPQKTAAETDKKVTTQTQSPAGKPSVSIEDKKVAEKASADAKRKAVEEHKKAIEERKAKILAEREAAKKAKEEKQKEKTKN